MSSTGWLQLMLRIYYALLIREYCAMYVGCVNALQYVGEHIYNTLGAQRGNSL